MAITAKFHPEIILGAGVPVNQSEADSVENRQEIKEMATAIRSLTEIVKMLEAKIDDKPGKTKKRDTALTGGQKAKDIYTMEL
ncbi:hypothetical protein H0H87_003295, partial [Tephrocybe sp. NHM501043]